MKKNLWLLLSLCFLIMPVMAEDWLLIPNTNVSYDKDSIKYGDFGVVRVITKILLIIFMKQEQSFL